MSPASETSASLQNQELIIHPARPGPRRWNNHGNASESRVDVAETNHRMQELRTRLDPLYQEIAKVIVGQRGMVERLLVGLLTGGHILMEGEPGLAKSLAVRPLATRQRHSFQ